MQLGVTSSPSQQGQPRQEPDALLLPPGDAASGSTEAPAEPCGTYRHRELISQTKRWCSDLQWVLRPTPRHQLQLFARGMYPKRSPKRAVLEGHVPATSGGSFSPQLPPASRALWGPSLTGHGCGSDGNAETRHLLISQQLASSLERWELRRDLVHFASAPASHLNPRPPHKTCSAFICFAPKVKGEGHKSCRFTTRRERSAFLWMGAARPAR